MGMPPFHLAFAVRDLNTTHDFYVNRLGCKVGRTDEKWIDFDFFGHQISAHLKPCLLYTSPSPRDVEESRMPSSA